MDPDEDDIKLVLIIQVVITFDFNTANGQREPPHTIRPSRQFISNARILSFLHVNLN